MTILTVEYQRRDHSFEDDTALSKQELIRVMSNIEIPSDVINMFSRIQNLTRKVKLSIYDILVNIVNGGEKDSLVQLLKKIIRNFILHSSQEHVLEEALCDHETRKPMSIRFKDFEFIPNLDQKPDQKPDCERTKERYYNILKNVDKKTYYNIDYSKKYNYNNIEFLNNKKYNYNNIEYINNNSTRSNSLCDYDSQDRTDDSLRPFPIHNDSPIEMDLDYGKIYRNIMDDLNSRENWDFDTKDW